MNFILVYFSFCILALILASGSIRKHEVTTCLSECFYHIGWWFTIGMMLAGFLLLPPVMEILPNIFGFLMPCGIIFVGAAPQYLESFVKDVHKYSAWCSVVCSIVFAAMVEPWGLFMLLIAAFGFVDKKRQLLYAELACFLMTYLILFIKTLNH